MPSTGTVGEEIRGRLTVVDDDGNAITGEVTGDFDFEMDVDGVAETGIAITVEEIGGGDYDVKFTGGQARPARPPPAPSPPGPRGPGGPERDGCPARRRWSGPRRGPGPDRGGGQRSPQGIDSSASYGERRMGYSGGFGTLYGDANADGGDSADLTAAVRATRDAGGLGKFAFVQLSHSAAAATCVVHLVLYSEAVAASGSTTGKLIGVTAGQTSTATAYREGNGTGDYRGQILKFDLYNAQHYEVRVADPSSGSVDIRTWTSFGTPGA